MWGENVRCCNPQLSLDEAGFEDETTISGHTVGGARRARRFVGKLG